MNTKKLTWYVYGAGGLGRECVDIIFSMKNNFDSNINVKFLEDNPKKNLINNIEVCSFNDHESEAWVTIAVGEPELRKKLLKKVEACKLKLKSAISYQAYISDTAIIEEGCIIAPFCSIHANAKLALNSFLHTMSIVGHDCHVMKNSVLSSMVNLGGSSSIGEASFLGMGALVKENIKIGNQSIVGMSSVVYKDLQSNVIAIGNPARVAKMNETKKVFK